MHRIVPFIAPILAVAALAAPAAAVPEQVGLTARVVDSGTPITGNHAVTVRLIGVATGGAPVWSETQTVTATDGLIFLSLGTQTPLTDAILDGSPLWAEVQVDSTVLSPRLAVTSAAYAIRAGLAEDSEHLGGQPATAFATAGHTHAGVYLPIGTALACSGTDKVASLNPTTGSVTCAPDTTGPTYTAGPGVSIVGTQVGVVYGGSGASTAVARADHAHAGVYLPLGATLGCTGTQKMVSINSATGSVTCANDVDTDTNTTYTAGPGLTLGGTVFSATMLTTSNVNGFTDTVARADHHHIATCALSYTKRDRGNASALCIQEIALPAPNTVNWNAARIGCQDRGARLCTYTELAYAASAGQTIVSGRWLGDRVGDNRALRTNGTSVDDFDAEEDVTGGGISIGGYYCCYWAGQL